MQLNRTSLTVNGIITKCTISNILCFFKVMDLLCGTTAQDCNGTKLITYLGDTANGQTPFEIIFNTDPSNMSPAVEMLVYNISQCDLPFEGSVCSCQDCPTNLTCPIPPTIPPTESRQKIFGIDIILFSLICAYAGFAIIFVTAAVIQFIITRYYAPKFSNSNENSPLLPKSTAQTLYEAQRETAYGSPMFNGNMTCTQCICRAGDIFDFLLRRGFYYFGFAIAKFPWVVIIICVILVTPLCFGILKMNITTDPVKLWSSPDSEARLGKNYFDNHFGPFYRTEMLILTASDFQPYNYTTYPYFNKIQFGPVLHKEILHEVSTFKFIFSISEQYRISGGEGWQGW